MSKRYGRNQKRRHREKIAKLQDDLKVCEQTLDASKRIINDTAWHLRELTQTIEKFCINSILLPPKKIKLSIIPERVQLELMNPFDLNFDPDNFAPNASIEIIDLLSLEVFMESKYDFLKHQVHVIVEAGKGRTSYAISQEGLVNYPIDYLVRNLAPDIALKLAKILKMELK